MSLRVVIFRSVGLAGCAATGFGFYGLLRGADCARTTCTAEPGPFVPLLILGILVAMVGAIGGGRDVITGLFGAIGLGAIVAGLQSTGFGHNFGLIFGGVFLASAVLPVVAGALLPGSGTKDARLLQTGTRALATVLEVQDTGVSLNNNPMVRLRLQVMPEDGSPAFETAGRLLASRVDIPKVGDRRAVLFDPGDRAKFRWDPRRPGNQPAVPPSSPAEELERLARLHASGALTDAEFTRLKSKVISDLA